MPLLARVQMGKAVEPQESLVERDQRQARGPTTGQTMFEASDPHLPAANTAIPDVRPAVVIVVEASKAVKLVSPALSQGES